ncbi:hypothetical protein SARC_04236 [Sphaeroforma arctica JP610]|uniref:Uncharacterized protein n=1 Tax=Sphaeroforma arctica JP610 TaxID=667725 RepID=A0A0L0G354_9EUKA|nr:hypothetical protein SARC_04236 [Sphaeroforma arctica JP610]KNC83505.1 hypothetical protein SARC_04236 [Sphaeroforma arctica JP610]|eukprot:XP_014157407.1 hypothetical protein SARC_04236 [Sphaeroforma arctica JP610]
MKKNGAGCFTTENTLSWIDVDVSGLNGDGLPKARAGHCAAVVGTRVFVWSGRDGYRENHNNSQVCCQDLWLLETAPPPKSSEFSPQRITALTVIGRWSPVPTADAYRLQIMLCHDQSEVCTYQHSDQVVGRRCCGCLVDVCIFMWVLRHYEGGGFMELGPNGESDRGVVMYERSSFESSHHVCV